MLLFYFFGIMFAVHNVRLDGALDEFQMGYKAINTDDDGFVSVEEMGSYNRRHLSDEQAVIIDNGSDEMKVGFASMYI
jgi:hypothetical protein